MCDYVCRLCLAYNVRLIKISDTYLQDTYEKLTNITLNSMQKPIAACYLCVSQLRKCRAFTERVIRADELLTQMLQAGAEVTSKVISTIDREAHKLSANLAITQIECNNLDCYQLELEIKEEVPIEIEVPMGDADEMQIKNEDFPSASNPEQHSMAVQNEIIPEHSIFEEDFKKKIFICNDCDIIFNKKSILADHIIRNHNAVNAKAFFRCDSCPFRGTSLDSLEKHGIVHSKSSSLIKEEKTDTEDKANQDTICEFRSNEEGSLDQHLTTYTEEKPFKCPECDFRCTARRYLILHIRIHTGEKPYECPMCEYRARRRNDLQVHLRTHTGEKPYTCPFCGHKSTQKSGLKEHLLTHTGEKPYQCPECEYRCRRKNHLNRHLKIHTGEKPFQCSVCEYRCSTKINMKQHEKTHTGEKPYECKVCHKRFARRNRLYEHKKCKPSPKSDSVQEVSGSDPLSSGLRIVPLEGLGAVTATGLRLLSEDLPLEPDLVVGL